MLLDTAQQIQKSKSINAHMKYLHYAIILFLTNSLANSVQYRQLCTQGGRHYSLMYNTFALVMVILNITVLCYLNNQQQKFQLQTLVSLIISSVITLIIVCMTIRTMKSTQCIQIHFIEKQALFSSFRVIFMELLLVFACNHNWVERYNNSPGNVIWGYMFLTENWGTKLSVLFRVLGVLELVICVVSFLMNMLPFWIGIPGRYRKALGRWWQLCITMMAVSGLVGFVVFMVYDFGATSADVGANRMMQIFLSCNLVDLLFWLWGYSVITYSTPDPDQEKEKMQMFLNFVLRILPSTSRRTSQEQKQGHNQTT